MSPSPHEAVLVGAASAALRSLLPDLLPEVAVRLYSDLYEAARETALEQVDSLWIDAEPLSEEDLGALRLLRRAMPERPLLLLVRSDRELDAFLQSAADLGCRLLRTPLKVRAVAAALESMRPAEPSRPADELVAGLADQLNNPLAALAARLQLLDVALRADDRDDAADNLELAIRGAARMQAALQKLSWLSARLKPVCQPTDLGKLLVGWSQRAGLEVQLPDGPAILAQIDPQLFERALEGLVLVCLDLGTGMERRTTLRLRHAPPETAAHVELVLAEPLPLPCPESEVLRPFRLHRLVRDPDLGLDLAVARSILEAQDAQLLPVVDAGFLLGFHAILPK